MRKFAALTLIVSLLPIQFAYPVFGGQYEDAVSAYERGNYETAYRLLKPLAQQGIPEAQYNLGIMYSKGRGVPQDYSEAVEWYRKAAEQGYPNAQYNLGALYHNGQGVPQDYILAHMWFNLAASRFPPFDVLKRDLAIENRDRIASKMTPAQIAEAQRLAREWKPKKEGK